MASKIRWAAWGLVACVLVAAPFGCGTTLTNQCIPGESKACTGPNGCTGYQVCAESAEAFGSCICGEGSTSSGNGGSPSATVSGSGGSGISASSGSTGDGGSSSSSSNSGSTSSTGGAAPFSPKDLAGLSLWLDDDNGIKTDPQQATQVVHWVDSSGHSNEANSMGGNAQFFVSLDPGAVNGHDAVRIAAMTRLEIPNDSSLEFGTGDYAIAVVFKEAGQQDPLALWEKGSPQGGLQLNYSYGTLVTLMEGTTDAVSVAATDTNKFHYAIARGPQMRIDTDTTSATGPTAMGDVSVPAASIWICPTGGNGGATEIAEVIAVKGKVSDAEVASLKGYFKTKFGIGQ